MSWPHGLLVVKFMEIRLMTADSLILWVLATWLVGGIPFGLVITRLFGLGDLRQIGSGNIGATNVLRTGNKSAAVLTLLLDAGKGGIMVLLAKTSGLDHASLAAISIAAVAGHCFPVWLRFRGGKGVATGIGVILALNAVAGAGMCAVWLGVAAITRISSVAAMVSYSAAPLLLFWLAEDGLAAAIGGSIIGLISLFQHRGNIRRVLDGTEPKIGTSKKKVK